MRVKVLPANLQDKLGLPLVLASLPPLARWKALLLDGGYRSEPLATALVEQYGIEVQIVQCDPTQKGFQVLPKRWVIERTFAWLGKCRRLSKEYDHLTSVSESWIYIAMIQLMLKRLN